MGGVLWGPVVRRVERRGKLLSESSETAITVESSACLADVKEFLAGVGQFDGLLAEWRAVALSALEGVGLEVPANGIVVLPSGAKTRNLVTWAEANGHEIGTPPHYAARILFLMWRLAASREAPFNEIGALYNAFELGELTREARAVAKFGTWLDHEAKRRDRAAATVKARNAASAPGKARRDEEIRAMADDLRARHPDWKPADVKGQLAKRFGLTPRRIADIIRRP